MTRLNTIIIFSVISPLIITGCRQLSDGTMESGLNSPNVEVRNNIVVSSPVGKEIYNPGEIILIKWISPAFVTKVDIFLYKKSALKIRINKNMRNNGEIVWQIPHDIQPSNHYKIKMVNSFDEEDFGYSGMFGIQSE